MSSVMNEHSILDETSNRLETALLTPAVAGELKGWVTNVREAAATFSMDWTRYLHTVLHQQYAEIAKNDPEMSNDIEKMIATDKQLIDQFAAFSEKFRELEEHTNEVQWDEGKLAGERQRLEEAGITLIVQIKKQRLAAETWLSEAFYRDRGVKD